ncbi:conserved hypothetical protein [Pyrobaculum islandicum DSM 4184]|uniref:Uncharacterized protein n=1 Tax=Pyrobaculum islandicum (strain DSM 4184 / JCM 9189 / GEO3) TaxID=384616 RepID=A1RVP2_PYRIL|nr:hypothetical protein [Pyrobaculum islandicum]ABL89024.1 conserved hypothetical protein [Pyrobaculum islandicum DSM 4184]
MDLLKFIETFNAEIAKRLDVVESRGETNGLMEWVNGRVGNYEVYFLWFPKTKRLAYAVRGPGLRKEEVVNLGSVFEAVAYVERVISQLKK